MRRLAFWVTAALLGGAVFVAGQDEQPKKQADEPTPRQPAANSDARTALNLLGEVDAQSGESRRNENVQFNLVDNNALKELNVRLGATATIIQEFRINQGYFGSEFGKQPVKPVHARAGRVSGTHGNLFWNHNNSVLSARSFFQVGSVKPARENHYGLRLTTPLWTDGFLTFSASQNKIRGNVNGNVLIPLPSERTPLTHDPELRAIVQSYIDAYPNETPNRPDIADRAHNTNSIQRINTDSASAQIDQNIRVKDKLILLYSFTGQNVDSFQFVTGQNPDTDIKNHRARLTWNRTWSATTVSDVSAGFDRLTNLLLPASGAVGPINTARALTGLGPSPPIPVDRIQNRYRVAAQVRHIRGNHTLAAGLAVTRLQYNGEETDAHRGIVSFGNDFGRDAITNLRMGTPSSFIQAIGTTYRGYRNWNASLYLGDQWRARPNLTLDLGLTYEPFTRPVDITNRSDLPFNSDLNNWGPRFGFAYRLPGRWGTLRGAYSLLYGEIFPVTYGHERLNPPHSIRVFVPSPDLRDPLGDLEIDPTIRSSWVRVSPDLSTPYSHHYNLSWEFDLTTSWKLQLGYVGSRSHKLFLTYFQNRGRFVEGIPFTTRTVNERRPDANELNRLFINNGSRGYFDAARVTLITPRWKGLTMNVSYWFSKALDIGGSYTSTSSPVDSRNAVAQFEDLSHPDLKGPSNFHQPHAFLLQLSYETPALAGSGDWLHQVFGSWNISTVTLLKNGTPFSITSGSDAPGFGNVDGNGNDRPTVLDPSVLGRTIGHPDDSVRLLPRSAFRYINAPEEMKGNLGRNNFRKGRIGNINAGLWKTWPLSTDWQVMLRGEAINLTNTPQFAEPGTALANPNFAQINNTLNDGRTFRFLLRLNF